MARRDSDSAGPAGSPRNPNKPARRRRRWPWYVGGFFVFMIIGLIAMALLLPSVVSSDYGSRKILSLANSYLRGQVNVRDVDVSWRGPIQLQGVTVLDPQQRQVLAAEKAVMQSGIWDIVRSPMTFGQIDLHQPDVTVYMQQDQPPSIAQAFEPREPAAPAAQEPAEDQAAPAPKGQIVIHGGAVRLVNPQGQRLGVTDLNGQVTLDTLDDIQAPAGGPDRTGRRGAGPGQSHEPGR